MSGKDGFRRRAAIVLTDKSIAPTDLEQSCESQERLGRDKFMKFTKLNASNHAILNERKKDQQFAKIIQSVEKRKCTFYRMGFKSYEKQGKKKLFGQVLGLSHKQMKGTMYVGQLWANHEVGRFLKQNRIYMTKLKLMDKLQTLKKENIEQQKEEEESDIAGSCKSITTGHGMPSCRNIEHSLSMHTRNSTTSTSKLTFNHELQEIKGSLKQLKKTSGMSSLLQDVRHLERCKQNIQKVERKYFLKLIDID